MDDTGRERWDIDFDVAKSMRYHAYRRKFWDNADIAAKILTGISGAGVLIAVIGEYEPLSTVFAIAVAVTSVVDVVLRFGKRARLHDSLYRDFSLLAQDIAARESPSKTDLGKWRQRRIAIERKEPGIIDLLERRCAAEEAVSRGAEVSPEWQLSAWQVLISQFPVFSLPRGFKKKGAKAS